MQGTVSILGPNPKTGVLAGGRIDDRTTKRDLPERIDSQPHSNARTKSAEHLARRSAWRGKSRPRDHLRIFAGSFFYNRISFVGDCLPTNHRGDVTDVSSFR